MMDCLQEIPVGLGWTGLAASSANIVTVSDIRTQDDEWSRNAALQRADFRAVWAVPVSWEGHVIGVITVYERHVRAPSNHDHYLRLYAAQHIAESLYEGILSESQPEQVALRRFRRGMVEALADKSVRRDVQESWVRCRQMFGWPAQPGPLPTLTHTQLELLQKNNANLIRATRKHVNSLFERIQDLDCAVMLCDADGWLLAVMGNDECVRALRVHGFWPGANISERYCGNTAIGTALACRRAVYFHGYEHFFEDREPWSGAGAPVIMDETNRLVGAFSFVTRRKKVDEFIPPLVQSASIAIARAMRLEEIRQDVLRVHHSVISQLDYHIVFIDGNQQLIEERHPVVLPDEIRSAMLTMTKLGECDQLEIALGDRIYQADVRNIWDHAGQLRGTIGIFRDVTHRRQFERRMREAERLNILASLAAGIAHEIRNPLTTARGFLQLFGKRLTTDTDKRFLELTIQELDRISHLVEDFMSLAKPEQARYGHVDLTAAIGRVAQFIQPEAALRGVQFTVSLPTESVWVLADENQIKQVILNIVQNALHACSSQTDTVSVELATTDRQVDITISDTGCGIEPAQIHRIFEPFYTTKTSGTGLGLAISKRIIDEHRGRIEIDSEVGRGTTVRICLNRLTSTEAESFQP